MRVLYDPLLLAGPGMFVYPQYRGMIPYLVPKYRILETKRPNDFNSNRSSRWSLRNSNHYSVTVTARVELDRSV